MLCSLPEEVWITGYGGGSVGRRVGVVMGLAATRGPPAAIIGVDAALGRWMEVMGTAVAKGD